MPALLGAPRCREGGGLTRREDEPSFGGGIFTSTPARRGWALATPSSTRTSSRARSVFEVRLDGDGDDIDGEAEGKGYTDVTVREAVEWTMGKDSEFTYIDVRSAEEHEKLATVRGALCIPAFEIVTPEAQAAVEGEEGPDEDDTAFAPDYNFEDLDYTVKPDFVDTVKAQFDLDAKLLIGCKTERSAKACQLLVDAGFTQIYNVESQIFMRTRAPQVWS
eukprot:g10857.t1